MRALDLIGRRFGNLTVIARAENAKNGKARWLCACHCGGTINVVGGHLTRAAIDSCGCLRRQRCSVARTRHGHAKHRNGASKHSTYTTWTEAKKRCFCPTLRTYKNYGGRGITMCKRWRDSYESFYEDMGDRPEGLSIDRVNNNGNYSCGKCQECVANGWTFNCRWATTGQQVANRRTPTLKPIAERKLRSKLSAADVVAIRLARLTGETHQSIADRYGVCRPSISLILSGRTFRHVP